MFIFYCIILYEVFISFKFRTRVKTRIFNHIYLKFFYSFVVSRIVHISYFSFFLYVYINFIFYDYFYDYVLVYLFYIYNILLKWSLIFVTFFFLYLRIVSTIIMLKNVQKLHCNSMRIDKRVHFRNV